MFKSEWSRTAALSLGVMAAVLIFSFLLFTSGFEPTYYVEGKLVKNAGFQMRPGDVLSYNQSSQNGSETVSFVFGKRIAKGANFSKVAYENCTVALLVSTNISTCIAADGRDGEGNASLSGPFTFFSPWMLAARENFSWSAATLNSLSGEQIDNVSVSYLGLGQFAGRDAYIFQVKESGIVGTLNRKVWVDAASRIVLKEEGENYTSEIILSRPLQP